jgi:hypothetical protein
MALQSSYTTKMGFIAPAAYLRITQFLGSKSGIRVTLEINYDAAARANGRQPIAMEMVQLSIADGATMQTMYDAIKLQPQFAGATDA